MLHIIVCLLLCLQNINTKQHADKIENHQYPKPIITKGYFISPVSHSIKISGTFGELRPNHFHTGIDIKANAGVAGDPIYAVADGWVSRIGVACNGYGNALYIDHPNGFTSVYAHMDEYTEEIRAFIDQEQKKIRSFEIQSYLEKMKIPVKKGQIIGKIGNTGSSQGAHLHFEIRETVSETAINPFLFGDFEVLDKTPPIVYYTRIYDIDKDFYEHNARNILMKKVNQKFVPTANDTIKSKSSKIGIGINTRDFQIDNWNKNGVYEIKMFVDDTLYYHIRMDSVTFFKTRMINAHLDYPEQKLKKNYVHKCFTLPGNTLGIIKKDINKGIIYINSNKTRKINFESSDYHGNKSTAQLFVKKEMEDIVYKPPFHNYILPINESSTVKENGVSVYFPLHTFFTNHYMKFSVLEDNSTNIFSNVCVIGNPNTPVFSYYKLSLTAKNLPSHLKSKAFIAECDVNNKIYNWGGTWNGNELTTDVRTLGKFYISCDTIKPKITPIIFNGNMQKSSKIVFKIEDNITTTGKTPLIRYNAYINNEWIVMVHDLKTKTITYKFPKNFTPGKYDFKLEVTDAVGNVALYEKSFIK